MRSGVPVLPGLLYGDIEGRSGRRRHEKPAGRIAWSMPKDSWPGRVAEAPDAMGYWPCQAVATHAIAGVGAIDSAVTASLGRSTPGASGTSRCSSRWGCKEFTTPDSDQHVRSGRHRARARDTVFTGGSIDALCDQVVAGAVQVGDVLAIFGATLIVWIVTDDWLESAWPHQLPAHHAGSFPRSVVRATPGALFVDWARSLLRDVPQPGTGSGEAGASPRGIRVGFRSGCPTSGASAHRSTTTPSGAACAISTSATDAAAIERAAFEASGFVIKRMIDQAGAPVSAGRGQRWRITGHGLDVGRGRCHRPSGRSGGGARRRRTRCCVLCSDGGRARDVPE